MIPENYSETHRTNAFRDAMDLALKNGSPCIIGSGLSADVMTAVNNVAQSFPNANKEQIDECHRLFRDQLNSKP